MKHVKCPYNLLGLYRELYKDYGKEKGNYYITYWGYIGGYIRILEKKTETTA